MLSSRVWFLLSLFIVLMSGTTTHTDCTAADCGYTGRTLIPLGLASSLSQFIDLMSGTGLVMHVLNLFAFVACSIPIPVGDASHVVALIGFPKGIGISVWYITLFKTYLYRNFTGISAMCTPKHAIAF